MCFRFLFSEVLLPYKKRPESTGMVARNLVAGALGIRNNVSKEQRQKEREMLKEARGKDYKVGNSTLPSKGMVFCVQWKFSEPKLSKLDTCVFY